MIEKSVVFICYECEIVTKEILDFSSSIIRVNSCHLWQIKAMP